MQICAKATAVSRQDSTHLFYNYNMCQSSYATGWDVQVIRFRTPLKQEGNLLSIAPTGVHPIFCVMCTGDSLLGVKELWCEAEHSLPCGAGLTVSGVDIHSSTCLHLSDMSQGIFGSVCSIFLGTVQQNLPTL